MQRLALILAGMLLVAPAAQAQPAEAQAGVPFQPPAAEAPAPPKAKPAAKPAPKPAAVVTPMAQRQLVVRVIDKQTRRLQELTLKKDQPVQFGRLTIVMRACEATDPTERPESGGFLQVTEKRPNGVNRRVFSGWMFASTPSLNAMEHPVYDVWVVQCKMTLPEIGPDTVVIRAPAPKPAAPKAEEGAASAAAPAAEPKLPVVAPAEPD